MRKRGLSSGRPSTTPLVLFLLLLALGASLGLDYIRFAKGERSYIFAKILPEKPAASPEEAFERYCRIMGSYGYVRDYNVEKYWRDCKIIQLWEGGAQLARIDICRAYYDHNL